MPSDSIVLVTRDLREAISGVRRHVCEAILHNQGHYDDLYDEENLKRELLHCLVQALAELEDASHHVDTLVKDSYAKADPTPTKVESRT